MGYLFLLPGLIIGLTVHEAAHALSAHLLGDDLAKSQGRISLNPLRHLSFWGTLALLVLGFGWGRPVPVNLYNFKHPKRDYLLVSLAGPASNVALAAVVYLLAHLSWPRWVEFLFFSTFIINAILALINMIPIPPLDGSKIWPCLIPGMRPGFEGKTSGIGVVVLLIGFYTGAISKIIDPTLDWLTDTMSTVMSFPKTYDERPEDLPDSLVAPDVAREATYIYYPSNRDHPASHGLRYTHPQADSLEALLIETNLHLNGKGWRQTEFMLSDPKRPSDSEWRMIREEGQVHASWTGYWIDAEDHWISIFLRSSNKSNEPNSAMLTRVRMYLNGPATENDETYWTYRKLHPEEFVFSEGQEPVE